MTIGKCLRMTIGKCLRMTIGKCLRMTIGKCLRMTIWERVVLRNDGGGLCEGYVDVMVKNSGKKRNRIMIAGIKSGSGKTMITCALLRILKDKELAVKAFKCGPDYIDPIFHETVLGVASKNLDTFFIPSRQALWESFCKDAPEDGISVIEGVMGLYDGVSGIGGEGSSYELASFLGCPIILTADVKAMGQSMIPMLSGFLKYDRNSLIRGVILNRIPDRFYERMKPQIERELGIKVLGHLRDEKELVTGSRHLGLKLPVHDPTVSAVLEKTVAAVSEGIDIEGILEISAVAQDPEEGKACENLQDPENEQRACENMQKPGKAQDDPDQIKEQGKQLTVKNEYPVYVQKKRHVLLARDEAFNFYYKDNISLLEEKGAVIDTFSILRDEKLPHDTDVIMIGGGYPELYLRQLRANTSISHSIRETFETGAVLVAECGGFMYLQQSLENDRERYSMCGIFDGKCRDMKRSVRFGYIELYDKTGFFFNEGESIRGHEFHYWDCDKNGTDAVAVKRSDGSRYDCCRIGERYFAGFAHLYYPSNPGIVSKILA